MIKASETVNAVAHLFCEATKEVLEASTGGEVTYSDTMQMIPAVHLRPDIGCFVLFSGDYAGLMIMNFSGGAALEIYRSSMLRMGLPEEDLSTEFTSDEVVNSIGELINQTIGTVRRRIEEQYHLVAHNTQPKAIALSSAIILHIDSADPSSQDLCRRLSFKVNGESFHIELSLERSEFVRFDGTDVHEPTQAPAQPELDFDKLKGQNAPSPSPAEAAGGNGFDFEALQRQSAGE